MIIYLPGWLNPAENLRPLAGFTGADFALIDFPADAERTVADMAEWVAGKITEPVYIVGHSFGGKVAIATAALYPEKVRGIFVIAGSNRGRLIFRLIRPAVKLAKWLGFSGERFRGADYKNSTEIMKKIMRHTLDFNIIPLARRVACPATFIYGDRDTTTPPSLGKKLARQIPGSKYFELAGFDHSTIITTGVYQASAIIKSRI